MKWIDREKTFPDLDRMLVFSEGDVYIYEMVESKWGNYYSSTDYEHAECTKDEKEWTHWMPLPKPPALQDLLNELD